MKAEFSFYNPKNSYQALHNHIPEDVDLLILNYYNLSYTTEHNQTVSILTYWYHYVYIYLNFFFISNFDGSALHIIYIGFKHPS
jgi:hypothetical protein